MTVNKSDLSKRLEESINRLEEARSNILIIMESTDVDINSGGFDSDMEDIEGSLFETLSHIEEVAQVIGEEVDNLRAILENIEDDS